MVFVFDPWSYHVLEETLGHVAPIFPGKKGGDHGDLSSKIQMFCWKIRGDQTIV